MTFAHRPLSRSSTIHTIPSVHTIPDSSLIRPKSRGDSPSSSKRRVSILDCVKSLDSLLPLEESPLFTYNCRKFTVGSLLCRTPSKVCFFDNRLEYFFFHPNLGPKIKMVMYYTHLRHLKYSSSFTLSFKINHPLECFPKCYDPFHKDHFLTVQFPTDIRSSLLSLSLLF
ncbi:hypothetical protein GEMRC1_003672 [Eukaryota sp. GEM-RC1]